jgi:hypothetical protein
MWEGLVECKACRFWSQFTKKELELKPGLMHNGLCHQFRSANWLLRMHRGEHCEHGELKRREYEPAQT